MKKQLLFKLAFAVFLTGAVLLLLFFNKENNSQNIDTSTNPQITDTRATKIDACVTTARKSNVPENRATKTCTCFFETAELKYPAKEINKILMAEPKANGTDNERALVEIISICMKRNPPEIVLDKNPAIIVDTPIDVPILPNTQEEK